MSKITTEKKEKKAKAEKKAPKQKTAVSGIPNLNKCCTCRHFPGKIKGKTQHCKISGKYVARKAEFPCYKCKFDI